MFAEDFLWCKTAAGPQHLRWHIPHLGRGAHSILHPASLPSPSTSPISTTLPSLLYITLPSSCHCRDGSGNTSCHMPPSISEQINRCSLAENSLVQSNWPHLSVFPYGNNEATDEKSCVHSMIFPLFPFLWVQLCNQCYFYVAVQRLCAHIRVFTLHSRCPHSPTAP